MFDKPAFYHPDEVRGLLQVSEPTLWRMRQESGFPDPVPLTRRKVVYRADDVHAWLRDRLGHGEPKAA